MANPGSVFISSTSEDLREFRNAARDAVLAARLRPEMMEYFAASGGPPLSECLELVTPCELLIVLVAQRYGWVPGDQADGAAKSITWLECEHAAGLKKDLLVFVLDKNASWPAERKESYRTTAAVEDGSDSPELLVEVRRNIGKLKEFQQWLETGRTRRTFSTPENLKTEIVLALNQWLAAHPEYQRVERSVAAEDPRLYLEWLREQTATIDIRGLGAAGSGKAHNFPIEDLYIPLTTPREAEGKERGLEGSAGRQPMELEEALTHRRLVIVGDPGSGKTTFLRRITYALTGEALAKQGGSKQNAGLLAKMLAVFRAPRASARTVFPMLIRVAELAEYIKKSGTQEWADSPQWLSRFLSSRNAMYGWGLSETFFSGRLADGSAIVLLDGLDEAPDRVEREKAARLFEKATEFYKGCRFVVTTRPQAYEGKALLRDFHEARIEPLNAEAIHTFLEHWCRGLFPDSLQMAAKHRAELSEALRLQPEIRKMARNPVMLTALAVVHWNERRLPEQRADLYDSILTWLSRQRENRPGREKPERCLALLQELALAMQTHPGGRQVRVAAGWAAEALTPEFAPIAERERLAGALRFLEEEAADSGIIVSRAGELQFWHLTFQEHMAAQAIAGRMEAAQLDILFKDGRVYRPEWREVMLLLAGILGVRQGKGKVDGLISAILKRCGAGLSAEAQTAGLVGAMVRDLRPLRYEPADAKYKSLLGSVLGIFNVEKAKGVEFADRLAAAEALGQAGDPRLMENNWVAFGTFEMGKYPVTVAEYKVFVEDDGYAEEQWWKEGGFERETEPRDWVEQLEHPNQPVTRVNWYEAAAYGAWKGARLPTEAEWEMAAAGKSEREYPWGNEKPDATRANFLMGPGHATPVGLYPAGATPEGLQDMAGNVWEWCEDWYEKGKYRVLRGGASGFNEVHLRSSYRFRNVPEVRNLFIGFRLARDRFS
jgi:hypothetical protein